MDNIEKAVAAIPISQTPEVYRQAADADFNLLPSGHTHGGQICLPGAASRSRLMRACRAPWAPALGNIMI
jgi:hypothetical protein